MTTITRILSITAALLIGTIAVANESAAANELDDFKKAIRVKYDMKEAAFAANDPEPIINHFYSDNVISTGPDGTTHEGRDGIRPIYEEVIGGTVRIESYKTFVNGDAGWDWVNFHAEPNVEGEAPFTFKMVFLWERIDGEWWSHGEMYVLGEFSSEVDQSD